MFAFSFFQSTVSTTWFLQVARGLSKSYQKHIFFVLFSFESQRLMFYASTKKTHLEQLENGRRSGTSHGKLTSDIFGNIVTHVNISECCSLVRGHHDFHSTLMKCISLVESSSLDWLLTENEIWIYSLSLSLYGVHRKSLILWDKFWNCPRATPPPTRRWHLEVSWELGD